MASQPRIATERRGNRDVLVNGSRDGLADLHHVQDRGGVPAAHQLALEGHDRKIVSEAFQYRIAAGPTDAVQHDVTASDRCEKAVRRKARQEDAMIRGLQAEGSEGTFETRLEQLGDVPAPTEFDEDKLAVRYPGGDTREDFVELRQVFGQRLRAPINHGISPQPEFAPSYWSRYDVDRLVMDGKIGQSNQFFRIMRVGVRRLHQVAAEKIVDGRKSARDRMAPGRALHRRKAHRRELRRHLVHPDFGKQQNMRRIVGDLLPPGIERTRSSDEPIAQCRRDLCFAVAVRHRCDSRTRETAHD